MAYRCFCRSHRIRIYDYCFIWLSYVPCYVWKPRQTPPSRDGRTPPLNKLSTCVLAKHWDRPSVWLFYTTGQRRIYGLVAILYNWAKTKTLARLSTKANDFILYVCCLTVYDQLQSQKEWCLAAGNLTLSILWLSPFCSNYFGWVHGTWTESPVLALRACFLFEGMSIIYRSWSAV